MSHTVLVAPRRIARALCLGLAMLSAGCATHHIPDKCATFPELHYYGYYPTCWRQWPAGWGCAYCSDEVLMPAEEAESVATPDDMVPYDVGPARQLYEPTAPEFHERPLPPPPEDDGFESPQSLQQPMSIMPARPVNYYQAPAPTALVDEPQQYQTFGPNALAPAPTVIIEDHPSQRAGSISPSNKKRRLPKSKMFP